MFDDLEAARQTATTLVKIRPPSAPVAPLPVWAVWLLVGNTFMVFVVFLTTSYLWWKAYQLTSAIERMNERPRPVAFRPIE